MKNIYKTNMLSLILVLFFILIMKANASTHSNNFPISKADSMPDEITREWMNDLRDENGNKIIPDDEGDAMQSKIFSGGSGEQHGYSVSNAGDVNGDGYDDIIAGAPAFSSNTGRAYIYFGGVNMNTNVDVLLTGETITNYFGRSVSTAGDVNGDGYSDVIVGAEGYSSFTGRAYIFLGGASMNNVADVTMTGEAASNLFANSVSSAGDVNGDGFADVMIGAQGYDFSVGRAYIFYGGAVMNNVADFIKTGEGVILFGISVSNTGDVNGDGFADVVVGASGYSSSTGRTYIFLGGSNVDTLADIIMTGEATNSQFGRSVSTADDVNGDGYSDVIVGAENYSSGTGRAYIFFGGASMNNTADVVFLGANASQFGNSVSTAGDINCDGYSDVIVAASIQTSNTGKAYIFFGGVSMNANVDLTLSGASTGNFFGKSVSTTGDVNGDGYSDIVVGAFGFGSNAGRTYLFDYYMSGNVLSELSITGEASNNLLGVSVSSAGDVNGDGYEDVIVGAYGYNSSTGRAYIFFGGDSLNNVADVTMNGQTFNNFFGVSVSGTGDINGDGYDDVIAGANGYSTSTGRAYIFFGGLSMDNVADVTMTGEATNNSFGQCVSSAGDVNNDGNPDVIVGAPAVSTGSGRAYIFYGGSGMDNIADVTFPGGTPNSFYGSSLSTAGDVNGDGYSDVLIGLKGNVSTTGNAYVYFGAASMDVLADVIMTGEAADNSFGVSVSTAGDVNRDGYSDIVIGASGYNLYTGRAYVFFGGSSMNNIADVIMNGESTSNNFGSSVSYSKDINSDNYSDILVGAFGYNTSTGRAYVFYGSQSMNNVPDVTMTGESTNSQFGASVSSAGDVNNDGFPDIITGAPIHSSNTGRAFIFLSSANNVKPNIISVKDVANDQGGYINLKFSKSSFDVYNSGSNGIDYHLERSSPPGINGYQWISVGSIPGTYYPTYIAEIHTPQDSGISGNNTFFFRVTAVSNSTGEFWRSNIMSGYSTDNLSPLPPANLTGNLVISQAQLSWNQNNENDLMQYIIYRNGVQIATSLTTNYNDTTIIPDSTYTYWIAAQDIHGNISGQSNSVIITYTVSAFNITLIQEGFYNLSNEKLNMKDTVRAYLHSNVSPFNLIDSSTAVIDSTNFTGLFKFFNAPSGTYYIRIKHRNTIDTWSKSGGETFTAGTTMNYNFTSAQTNAFGSNMIQIDSSPLRYAIYSGDENKDGTIDVSDVVDVYNDALNFASGYLATDINGDDFVDVSDMVITYNNSINFVGMIMP